MATETVTDYLGHPCKLTEARWMFSQSLDDARDLELRAIRRQIGMALVELSARLEAQPAALKVIEGNLAGIGDSEGANALVAMAADYGCETSNKFSEFTGLVLAILELAEADHVFSSGNGGGAG